MYFPVAEFLSFVLEFCLYRILSLFFSVKMSHTGEIKNCSQALTGVSLTYNYTFYSNHLLYLKSLQHNAFCLFISSSLPACSHTLLFWWQTSWLSITAGELAGAIWFFSLHSYCHSPFFFFIPPPRLIGGLPPYASVYPTWVHCWKHLSREVSSFLVSTPDLIDAG